jgi:hypothetical protein
MKRDIVTSIIGIANQPEEGKPSPGAPSLQNGVAKR